MDLEAVVAWIALLVSLGSLGFSIYNRKYPPKPEFKIITKSSKSTLAKYAKY